MIIIIINISILVYEFITPSITIIIIIIIIIDQKSICTLFELHFLPLPVKSNLKGKPYYANMLVKYLCLLFFVYTFFYLLHF